MTTSPAPAETSTRAPWHDAGRRALPWAGLVVRLVVGGVWIAAGLLKLPDPAESVRAVRAYRLLPEFTVHAVGYGLPFLEIIVGLLLVVGLGTRIAAVISAVLFVLFIVGITAAWARGLQIDCGCFGGGGYAADATSKYPWEIARDAGLLLGSVLLVIWPRTRLSLDGWLVPDARSEA
ncbi:MAG TPA: MauE/DoxX family redox-associated membrane protein [Nocardioidaceae bacterium]|jgi:uncharacterized membrane protein YphA (DoxX/SURF4 family)